MRIKLACVLCLACLSCEQAPKTHRETITLYVKSGGPPCKIARLDNSKSTLPTIETYSPRNLEIAARSWRGNDVMLEGHAQANDECVGAAVYALQQAGIGQAKFKVYRER